MNQQLDLLAGEAKRDHGIAMVSLTGADFLERARTAARSMGRMSGKVSCDDIREWAEVEGVKPHHPNLWGAIFAGKEWVCVGRQKSQFPSNHAREIRIWALK